MRFTPRAILVLLTSCLLVMGTSGAANWYVDGNSAAGSPEGSMANPYLKINDALNDPLFVSGDMVFVAAATYSENVNVSGKEAHLFATEGPTVTVIHGGGTGSAVNLYNAGSSTVSGFTITGGQAQFGGGVEIFNSSPTITNNIIIGNNAVAGVTYPSVGGGIDAYLAGGIVISGNLIVGNHADGEGGGIHLEKSYPVDVKFNTLVGNTIGGGLSIAGSGINLFRSDGWVQNNILAGNTASVGGKGGIELTLATFAVIEGNILFQNLPADFLIDGLIQPLPDGAGNFSADPRFVDSVGGNYRIPGDSPAIDSVVAGSAPPAADLDGNPIPVDGDGEGSATADRGCYEHLGSLGNLTVSLASVVSWGAAFEPPDGGYHVYRGTPSGLASGDAGVCQDARDGDLFDTQFSEPEDPALAGVFTFLAGFELRGADSGLSRDTSGNSRMPLLACP